jgi:hypothetical protein
MNPEDYIERAKSEIARDNKLRALSLIEEGLTKFNTPELQNLLKQTREALRHLRDRDSYHTFYEGSSEEFMGEFRFRKFTQGVQ